MFILLLLRLPFSTLTGNVTGLYKLKAFLFICWYSCLKQDRVRPVLSVEEGHVAVHSGEEVDALVPLLKITV